MQGSFTDTPVYSDNNVHSHLLLEKCPETLVPQQKVRDFSSPHCQFSLLDKKTEVPPTANTGHSPPTKKACLVTERSYLAHITTVFSLLDTFPNNLLFLLSPFQSTVAKTTLTQNNTFSSSHT